MLAPEQDSRGRSVCFLVCAGYMHSAICYKAVEVEGGETMMGSTTRTLHRGGTTNTSHPGC